MEVDTWKRLFIPLASQSHYRVRQLLLSFWRDPFLLSQTPAFRQLHLGGQSSPHHTFMQCWELYWKHLYPLLCESCTLRTGKLPKTFRNFACERTVRWCSCQEVKRGQGVVSGTDVQLCMLFLRRCVLGLVWHVSVSTFPDSAALMRPENCFHDVQLRPGSAQERRVQVSAQAPVFVYHRFPLTLS